MDTGYNSEPYRNSLSRNVSSSLPVGLPNRADCLHASGPRAPTSSTRNNTNNRLHSSGSSTPREDVSTSSDMREEDIVSHRAQIHADELTDEEADETPKILLAVVWYGGNLGAAYYDTESAILHVLLDMIESDTFTMLKKLVLEIRPNVIITSAKQDARMMQVLQKFAGEDDSVDDDTDDNREPVRVSDRMRRALDCSNATERCDFRTLLEILPNLAFSYEAGKRRITSTELPGIPDHYTELERTLYFSSRIPFGCTSAVRATGGLIRFLSKHRIGVGLEDEEVQTPILDFKIFTLSNVMFVEKSAYSALQIFKKIDHPAVFKMGSGSKEGLSLFGILNRTRSRPGRKLMRLWFSRPLTDKAALERRLDAVEYFADPKNLETVTRLQDAIKHTRNLSRILKVMKTASASVNDWLALYKTVVSVVSVAQICRSSPRPSHGRQLPGIFTDIAKCSSQEIVNVVKLIYNMMDRDESIAVNRFVVMPGIDDDLDKRKHQYNGLPSYLQHVARAELQTFQGYITNCHILYMRRVGYMLGLRESENVNESSCSIPGLDYMLTDNGTCFYKTERTRELDEDLGDILEDIADMETRIMHQLQNTILDYTPYLMEICQCVAELDCLISFATVAKDLGYVRPSLTTENIIEVKKGRHPLQECTVSLFVPNDVMLGGQHGRMKMVTGPNACGKSIFLKQAGLIVFMAHIGSFVPAESATVGIVSKIYTRVRTMESLSTGLSTFAVDLNQMSSAVSEANKNTLVLVDEFGKGTATVDGVSLLASCLTQWIEQKEDAPFVICSTHFHSLVKQNHLPQSQFVRYHTLETLRDRETDDLVFLYQLTDGVAGCSYAAHIALLAGLPREIVVRGREVTTLIRENAPVRRYDRSSTRSFLNRCDGLAKKLLAVNLEDTDLGDLMKNIVTKEMETPRVSSDRGNTSASLSDTSVRKVTSSLMTSPCHNVNVVRRSDVEALSDNDEDILIAPKRACRRQSESEE